MLNVDYMKSAIKIQKVLHEYAYRNCDYEEAVDYLYDDMMHKLPMAIAQHIYDLCFMRAMLKDEAGSMKVKHDVIMDHINARMAMASNF